MQNTNAKYIANFSNELEIEKRKDRRSNYANHINLFCLEKQLHNFSESFESVYLKANNINFDTLFFKNLIEE